MNNKEFIEELNKRNLSLADFFCLLNIWEDMNFADKEMTVRKLIEEEKKNDEFVFAQAIIIRKGFFRNER